MAMSCSGWPQDVSFNQFARVLVFIYPCFIGIFQGSNLVSVGR